MILASRWTRSAQIRGAAVTERATEGASLAISEFQRETYSEDIEILAGPDRRMCGRPVPAKRARRLERRRGAKRAAIRSRGCEEGGERRIQGGREGGRRGS